MYHYYSVFLHTVPLHVTQRIVNSGIVTKSIVKVHQQEQL